QPPEEYDFKIVFMRTEGNSLVGQTACKSDRQFMWIMDGYKSTVSGIDVLNGKEYNSNETTFKGQLLTNNKWHTSIVQLRNSGVTALMEAKAIVKLATTYDKLKLKASWKLRDATVLGLASNESRAAFSTVEITEVTGSGKRTR